MKLVVTVVSVWYVFSVGWTLPLLHDIVHCTIPDIVLGEVNVQMVIVEAGHY